MFFNEHLTNIIKIYIANDKVYIYKKLINCKLFENIMNDNNNILFTYKKRIKYDFRKQKFRYNKMPNQKFFNRAYKTTSKFFKAFLVISLFLCFLLIYKKLIKTLNLIKNFILLKLIIFSIIL